MDPRVSHHDDVVLSPYTLKKNLFHGGFPTTDFPFGRINRIGGNPIDVPHPVADEDVVDTLPGRALYAGFLYDHFGHVMTEAIHRLWAYDERRHDHVVFAAMCFDGKPEMLAAARIPGYLEEILKLFGIRGEACAIVRRPTRIEHLDVAEPGSQLQIGVADWYRDFLRGFSTRLGAGRDGAEMPKRIFLGRHHILRKGTLLGEKFYFDTLAEFGFTFVRPEHWSIAEQSRAMANAEAVVFVEGSAIYSTELLAELPGRFVMIPRRNFSTFYTPHLAPKGAFSVAGDLNAIHRCRDRNGALIPSSPVVTHAPQSIYDDLAAALGLTLPPFDPDRFGRYVADDIEALSPNDAAYRDRMLEQAFPSRETGTTAAPR